MTEIVKNHQQKWSFNSLLGLDKSMYQGNHKQKSRRTEDEDTQFSSADHTRNNPKHAHKKNEQLWFFVLIHIPCKDRTWRIIAFAFFLKLLYSFVVKCFCFSLLGPGQTVHNSRQFREIQLLLIIMYLYRFTRALHRHKILSYLEAAWHLLATVEFPLRGEYQSYILRFHYPGLLFFLSGQYVMHH